MPATTLYEPVPTTSSKFRIEDIAIVDEFVHRLHEELGDRYVIAGSMPLAMVLESCRNEAVRNMIRGAQHCVRKINRELPHAHDAADIDVFTDINLKTLVPKFPGLVLTGRLPSYGSKRNKFIRETATFMLKGLKFQFIGVEPDSDTPSMRVKCTKDFDIDICCCFYNHRGLSVSKRALLAFNQGYYEIGAGCRARLSRMYKYAERGWSGRITLDEREYMPAFEDIEYITPDNIAVLYDLVHHRIKTHMIHFHGFFNFNMWEEIRVLLEYGCRKMIFKNCTFITPVPGNLVTCILPFKFLDCVFVFQKVYKAPIGAPENCVDLQLYSRGRCLFLGCHIPKPLMSYVNKMVHCHSKPTPDRYQRICLGAGILTIRPDASDKNLYIGAHRSVIIHLVLDNLETEVDIWLGQSGASLGLMVYNTKFGEHKHTFKIKARNGEHKFATNVRNVTASYENCGIYMSSDPAKILPAQYHAVPSDEFLDLVRRCETTKLTQDDFEPLLPEIRELIARWK